MYSVRSATFSKSVITKIGIKYFWTDNNFDAKFSIETGECKTDRFAHRFKVYFSHEQWEDECRKKKEESELSETYSRLKSKFNYYGRSPFTLDQLRRIEAITNE